jgi:single-strand DNA-binding protein
MNPTVNKVEIIGYLGQDPEFRQLREGGQVANLSLSTSVASKDKQSGEWTEYTEWHRISVFGNNADRLQKSGAGKGELVRVEGQLTTRKWQDQDGNDRYSTEIRVAGYGASLTVIRTKASPKGGVSEETTNQTGNDGYDLDDDIPF